MFITCGMSNIDALWHEPSAVRCFDLQPLLVDPTHPDVLHHRNALRIDHHHAQRRVRLTWNGRTGERLTTCARCRRARGRGSSAPSMLRSTSTACVPKLSASRSVTCSRWRMLATICPGTRLSSWSSCDVVCRRRRSAAYAAVIAAVPAARASTLRPSPAQPRVTTGHYPGCWSSVRLSTACC